MNRLEQVHEVLDSDAIYKPDFKQYVPEPEPSREVRIARLTNALLQELDEQEMEGDGEVVSGFGKKLYQLRNEFEEKAIDDVIDRVDVDRTGTGFGMSEVVASDPISKIQQSISEEMVHRDDPERVAAHYLAQEVVK